VSFRGLETTLDENLRLICYFVIDVLPSEDLPQIVSDLIDQACIHYPWAAPAAQLIEPTRPENRQDISLSVEPIF
jgi:hypothetical protein